jgi:hypothetical protein
MLLVGCSLDLGGDAVDAPGEGDADVGGDAVLGPCPAYSGLTAAGRAWTWRYTDEQAAVSGPGEWTVTLVSLEADGTWTTETEGLYDVPNFDYYRIRYEQSGGCDEDGAWTTRSESVTEYALDGMDATLTSTTTFTTPYLLVPAGVTAGGEWEVAVEGTTESSAAPPSDFAYTLVLRAVRVEDVSVPAGDFAAMRFATEAAGGEGVFWADAGIGSVATSGGELVSFE